MLDYETLFVQGQIEGMVRTEIYKQKAVCGGKNRNFTSYHAKRVDHNNYCCIYIIRNMGLIILPRNGIMIHLRISLLDGSSPVALMN